MKIAILTLPFNNNYGGILQSFALQKFLEGRGHEVIVISQPVESLNTKIRNLIRVALGRRRLFNNHNFVKFLHCMKRSKFIYNDNELKKYCLENNFEAVVVGSDQVWRFKYTKHRYSRFFLEFLENNSKVKRVSFAASFGVDFLEASSEEQKKVTNLLSKFNGVSVREHSGVELCRKNFDFHNAMQLLDPTLLHDAAFYRKLYKGNEVSFKGKIGVYILDENHSKNQFINTCKDFLKIKSDKIGKYKSFYGYDCMTIPQWLHAFDTSDFIITDSFHGMVFSIIFRKKFLVIGNKARGLSRFTSLLKDFDMLDRLVEEDSLINSTFFNSNKSEESTLNIIERNIFRSNQFLIENGL